MPRFIAISEFGICLKWNSKVPPEDFEKEAYRKLHTEIECGCVWDVCVLYRPSEVYKTRIATYFTIRVPYNEHILKNQRSKVLTKQVAAIRRTFIKLGKTQKSKRQLFDYINTLANKLEKENDYDPTETDDDV